jgi:hypothetical protein
MSVNPDVRYNFRLDRNSNVRYSCTTMYAHNLINKRFGKLKAKRRVRNPLLDRRDAWWLCECDCGCEVSVPAYNLKRGNTKSCGCLKHGPKPDESPEEDDLL